MMVNIMHYVATSISNPLSSFYSSVLCGEVKVVRN